MDRDKISYWEERTINIGNYENVKCGLTYSTTIKDINMVDKTISISELDSISFEDENSNYRESLKRVQNRVKKVLDAREADIRLRSEEFQDDFSPSRKALIMGTIDLIKASKKTNKLKIELDEIDDFDDDDVFDKD